MCPEWVVLFDRPWSFGAVGGNTAWEDERVNVAVVPIDLGNGLHYPGSPGDVDLPHALNVEHAALQGIDNEGEMHDGAGVGFLDDLDQLTARRFAAEINLFKLDRKIGAGRSKIYPNDLEVIQQPEKSSSQVAGDAGYDDRWFGCRTHDYLGLAASEGALFFFFKQKTAYEMIW